MLSDPTNNLTIPTDLIIAILSPLMAIALGWLLIGAYKLRRSLACELQRVHDLQKLMTAQARSQQAMSNTLCGFEKKLAEITQRNEEIQAYAPINTRFEEASQMARNGVCADTLVQSCGLSNEEAHLMIRLHSA